MSTRFNVCAAILQRVMRNVVSIFLLVLVASSAQARVNREDFQRFRMKISLEKSVYTRGGIDSSAGVDGLVVKVTLINPHNDIPEADTSTEEGRLIAADLAVSMERPNISAVGGYRFEIVPSSLEISEGSVKPLARNPLAVSTFDTEQLADITIPHGQTRSYKVDIGSWYAVDQGGKYELTCIYQEERSNTVTFEVLPIKVVNAPYYELRHRFADIERGANAFPYMFYVVQAGRFNEVVFAYRRGKDASEHLEFHRLGLIPIGTIPYMEVNSTNRNKVSIRLPDKHYKTISHIFSIDFNRTPLLPVARLVEHAPDSPPSLAEGTSVKKWDSRTGDANNTPDKALRALHQSLLKGNKLAFCRGVVAKDDAQKLATSFFSMASNEARFFELFIKTHGKEALAELKTRLQGSAQQGAKKPVAEDASLASQLFDASKLGQATRVDANTYTYLGGWTMRKVEGKWLLDPVDITKDMPTEVFDALIKLLDGFSNIYATNSLNINKMNVKELAARMERSSKMVVMPLMPMMIKMMMQNSNQDGLDIDTDEDEDW